MATVSVQYLQKDPDALLDRVEAGEQLFVVRDGRPVAELRPVSATRPSPRPFGLCAGAFTVPEDFDAPLPGRVPAGAYDMSQEPRTIISPHFPPEKLDSPSIDDLIDVFEDRLSGWLLGPAKRLLEHPVDQIPGFALSLSYFEGIAIYMRGEDSKNKSKPFFREGFVDVFRPSGLAPTLLERVADVFYEDGRCGFFHDAMFRTRVYFSDYFGEPIVITVPKVNGVINQEGEIQSLVVHCPKYFEYLEGHFTRYVTRLRDRSESSLRKNFQAACDLKWGLGGPPRVIVL